MNIMILNLKVFSVQQKLMFQHVPFVVMHVGQTQTYNMETYFEFLEKLFMIQNPSAVKNVWIMIKKNYLQNHKKYGVLVWACKSKKLQISWFELHVTGAK